MSKNNLMIALLIIAVLVVGFGGGSVWRSTMHTDGDEAHHHMMIHGSFNADDSYDMPELRMSYLEMRDLIVGKQFAAKKYACCLEKPCTYCIEKTPGHGEGAACNCLDDVMNGRHPCGECIGEILEGHGNPLIAEYFATAVSEEVGEQYTDTIKQIITDKYSIPLEAQV